MRRNLTVQLEEDTIRKARVLAARRSSSISQMVASEIDRLVGEDQAYRQARTQALQHLAHPFHLGGGTLPRRDSLHER